MALAFSQSRQIDGSGAVLAPDYLDYTSDISGAWAADFTHEGRDEVGAALAVKNVIPNVSAVLFRRDALVRAFDSIGDELFEYRIAGDWLIYMQVLLQGRMFFRHTALNSHRRHAQSVTKSGIAELHLREVARAQDLARSYVAVSPETSRKASRYLEHVRTYLGLPQDADASA
jgi:hypothetical protein